MTNVANDYLVRKWTMNSSWNPNYVTGYIIYQNCKKNKKQDNKVMSWGYGPEDGKN